MRGQLNLMRELSWMLDDSGSMITYEEVDVDEEELTGRRRSSKKNRHHFLPYFILYSLPYRLSFL